MVSILSLSVGAETCHQITIDKDGGPESVIESGNKENLSLNIEQAKAIYGYSAMQIILNKQEKESACLSFKDGKRFQVGSTKTDFKSKWKDIPSI